MNGIFRLLAWMVQKVTAFFAILLHFAVTHKLISIALVILTLVSGLTGIPANILTIADFLGWCQY